MHRVAWLAIFGLIVLSAVPRLVGVYDDFWLDEILSQRTARQMRSPVDVLRHPAALNDNNHPLNTLWMWSIGNHAHWRIYRIPAVVTGIGAVILAALIMRRFGPLEALLATILIGLSYPLIAFSSEARGYAPAIFFALLALLALDRFLATDGWIWSIIFWIACLLGLLSHLTFVFIYVGLAVWSGHQLIRRRRGAIHAINEILQCHLVPTAGLIALYTIFVRHIQILGAPPQATFAAIRDAVGSLLGAGPSEFAGIAFALVGAALFGWSLWTMHRRGSDGWVLLLFSTLMAPVLLVGAQMLLFEHRQPISARYFLLPYLVWLLGLSILLGGWLRGSLAWRAAGIAVLAGFVAINLWHTMHFLRWGRGDYLEAIAHMSRHTPAREITVLSDDPTRTELVLRYYETFLPPPQQLIIYDGTGPPPVAPQHGPPLWIIVHSNRRGRPPETNFNHFLFDRELSYYGFSGYSWYLYRHRVLWPAAPGMVAGTH